MTAALLASALAARLAVVLPPGFRARSDGSDFYLDAPDGLGSATSLAHLDGDDVAPQDYADAAWNVLSMAQDVVSETIVAPWPAAAGSGSDLAEPSATVDGSQIHLFFGPEDNPVLTLPPIAIDPP
jgi:hypothetical protein